MDRGQLIYAIIDEIERVWPDDAFDGTVEQYEWLERHYGITEKEDVRWLDVLAEWSDDHIALEDTPKEVMEWMRDESAVCEFLESFLAKYTSNTQSYTDINS